MKPHRKLPANTARQDTHATAAELAHALVESRKFLVPEITAAFPLLTLGDVLVFGAMMASIAAQFQGDTSEGTRRMRSLHAQFSRVAQSGMRMDEGWWTAFIEKGFQAGQIDPVDLRSAIFQAMALLEKPHRLRGILSRMIKNQFPTLPPGRQHLIGPENYAKLCDQAEKWRPISRTLIPLLESDAHPAHSLRRALETLQSRFPTECALLRENLPRLETILRHKVILNVKTLDGKARRLADALAGAEFGLSPAYAIKRVQAARKAAR